ncbi:MAG: hypothetical protein V2A73_15935 [Pseudomonadota bacterium]
MGAAKTKSDERKIRIEYMPLSQVVRAPRNPRWHADKDIQASIEAFGYVQPAILDERTGKLVAGHGRLDALLAMKQEGKPPPPGIAVTPDDWKLPVIRGVSFRTQEEAEAFLLADNQTTVLGGWHDDKLAAILKDLQASDQAIIGWAQEEVDVLLGADLELEIPTLDDPSPDDGLREYKFRVSEEETATVDRAFVAQRGKRREADDARLFVAICRAFLKLPE